MGISEAKKFIGQVCAVRWLDRKGQELSTISRIHDVTYVPMYGGYLIADTDDIPLDKLTGIEICEQTTETRVAA